MYELQYVVLDIDMERESSSTRFRYFEAFVQYLPKNAGTPGDGG